jgi:hypothetical protein
VITLHRAHETVSGHTIRAWTGPATDEGVGLIAMLEVSDSTGRPVCRFEEFLDAAILRTDASWPRDDDEASRVLQERAVDRARVAVLGGTLSALHGHRYDVT